ncbi:MULTISPECIES: alanine racemase [Bacillus]|uniref:alanine racemase n=1 Tax=Bacillus TaxID=1386 RepID=UPI0003807D23|nr:MULTISPECIES: alanine racemase [Bacillus]PEP47185.1 alanine racemase [Bacillus pseudomycoides]PGR98041.1 alanine racemase [Bacillus pseudomycoides]PHC82061.1 alanine racemase [Bacillus pseudomycoides]
MSDTTYATWAEIHLDSLAHNYQWFRKNISPNTKIFAVVKANAYGHGLVPIANCLMKEGVDGFTVVFPYEGIELRRKGIDLPIIILSPFFSEQAKEIVRWNLTPSITHKKQLLDLAKWTKLFNVNIKVHIKVDTGLARSGSRNRNELLELLKMANELPGIEIEGVFTHFASADHPNALYLKEENERFLKMIHNITDHYDIPLVHAAATAATIRSIDTHFDMVRIGLGLYGYDPLPDYLERNCPLRPVMTLNTRIAYLKWIEEGESIGYNRQYTADKPMHIATVPIGYADGMNRRIANRYSFHVDDQCCKIRGNLCMDQIMIDVTKVENVGIGQKVTVMGRDQLTARSLAECLGTAIDEVLCSISTRVPRLYLKQEEFLLTL